MYRKLFLILLVIFCLNVCTVFAQSREEDSLALVELYNSTNGDGWTNNTNWNSGTIDTWYGVTVSGGRVTELSLNGNGLDGTIPASIGNLSNLTRLNLDYNNFSGSIPSSIGNLTNLTTLYIRGRSVGSTLGGSIPSEIGNLTNLQHLKLTSNHLSGSIPSSIGNLTNLISLDLSVNGNLSGSIPSSIGNLANLTNLDLNRNSLSGSIPSSIGDLTSLTDLDLRTNDFSGSIPSEIGNLTNLQHLNLNDNSLSGSIPSSIGDLSNLVELFIANNQLTGSIPTSIGDLSQLEELSFYNNQLTGSVPSSIGNLSQLRSMHILGNNLEELPGLSGLTLLNWLEIQNNKFTFEDIEPNVNVPSTFFNYSPQAKVGEVQNEIITEGSDFTISVSVGGEHNEYQWKKDGSVISGATNDSYTITSAEMSDAGSYTCEITNTVAIYLILYSNPINITVNPAPPAVVVTSPNGGEDWLVDSTYNITWTSNGTSGNVKIEYSTNNGSSWTEEAGSTTDDGFYSWTIPDEESTNCLVRVSDTDGDPTDESDAVFTISSTPPPPEIVVTSPNGGEDWKVDSTYDITWISNGTTGNVKIEYSTNNGSSWTEEAGSTTDDGSYSWTIPDEESTNCLVRVSDTDGDPSDESDAVFTISSIPPLPQITVTSPNDGETWQIGTHHNITWTSNGTSGNVKIEYSANGGGSWTEEAGSTTDDGSYSWTIPDEESTNCLVRVSDTDGDPTDVSDAVFTISSTPPPPELVVTSPNGGEDWKVDSTYNITWNSNGTSGNVYIEYSIDNGSNWLEVIASMPDTGIYSWAISGSTSDSCMVRISDTDGNPTDVSDSVFTISSSSATPEDKLPGVYSMSVKTLAASNKFKVRYSVPEKASIKFGIYNINGTKVKELREEKSPGIYAKEINMNDSPAGAYFIKMEVGGNGFIETEKVVLVK